MQFFAVVAFLWFFTSYLLFCSGDVAQIDVPNLNIVNCNALAASWLAYHVQPSTVVVIKDATYTKKDIQILITHLSKHPGFKAFRLFDVKFGEDMQQVMYDYRHNFCQIIYGYKKLKRKLKLFLIIM